MPEFWTMEAMGFSIKLSTCEDVKTLSTGKRGTEDN